jgi:flagellar basal body-associated protein FliL
MDSNGGKPEPADPEQALRLLELEMLQQRAARQMAGTPYRGLRAVSFLFLFVVLLGAALAAYYLFFSGHLEEMRARNNSQPSPSANAMSRTP